MSTLYDTTYGPGIPLGTGLIPGSPTQGAMNANLLTGGFSTVPTLADLYAIPVDTSEGLKLDGLSSGRRQAGMVVTVAETGVRYELKIANFSTLSAADKLAALADNANWVVFATGGEQVYRGAYYDEIIAAFVVNGQITLNGSVTWKKGDTVTQDGIYDNYVRIFRCIQDYVDNDVYNFNTPLSSPTYWQLVAEPLTVDFIS